MDQEADERSGAGADPDADPGVQHDVGRTLTFSDGVFAIAITLLVLDLPVPELADSQAAGRLFQAVADLYPRFLAFGMSFLLVGGFWSMHRGQFRYIQRTDHRLIWLNLFFLMAVCLVPFSAGLVSRYGDTLPGMEMYAANIVLISLLSGTMRYYGERRGLFRVRGRRPARLWDAYGPAGIFALGMVVAVQSVYLGYATWAIVFPLAGRIRWLIGRRRHPSSGSQ